MFNWTWIGIIAGIITIIGTALALLKRFLWLWLKRHVAWVDLQDHKKPVTKERLSWQDVFEGIIKALLPDAQNFKPDAIFGINRGGAIVGGLIAKKLNIPQVFILDINFDRPTIVIEHRQNQVLPGSRVLLVDDALRTGDHMRAATKYLRDRYRNIELRRMVILHIMREDVGPEIRPRIPSVERYAFFTFDGRVKLPWDP